MTHHRWLGWLLAVLAGIGALLAVPVAMTSPMLFDSPHAGGWPVWLACLSMLLAPMTFFAAMVAAVLYLIRPRRGLLPFTVLVALAAPIGTLIGFYAMDRLCGGSTSCGADRTR